MANSACSARISAVAPVRERGLKYYIYINAGVFSAGRSREGAWIEISIDLKQTPKVSSRSREGAWIEII